MKKSFKLSEEAFQMDGKMPLSQAIPLGLQHGILQQGKLQLCKLSAGQPTCTRNDQQRSQVSDKHCKDML